MFSMGRCPSTTLAADTRGNGPALVLLHPGWGDSSIWRPLLERLPPHFRVVRYDTRGFGSRPLRQRRLFNLAMLPQNTTSVTPAARASELRFGSSARPRGSTHITVWAGQ